MTRRKNLMLAISGIAFALGLGAIALAGANRGTGAGVALAAADALPTVVVYKSPQCGCCQMWGERMKEAGFKVKVKNVSDLSSVKAKYGIPPHLETCHTAVVGDYVVEGHVPADAIKRLLREQPDVAGLAVPGMPKGSPGMEQGLPDNYDRYRVLAFNSDGSTAVYERY